MRRAWPYRALARDAFDKTVDMLAGRWASGPLADLTPRLAIDHAARIAHIHCKDVRLPIMRTLDRTQRSFLHAVVEGVFTVPGDGGVDFASVLGALPHYAGWLVVEAEQDPAKADPATYARKGHDTLARLVGR
mgnify:CR=1 FL=1